MVASPIVASSRVFSCADCDSYSQLLWFAAGDAEEGGHHSRWSRSHRLVVGERSREKHLRGPNVKGRIVPGMEWLFVLQGHAGQLEP